MPEGAPKRKTSLTEAAAFGLSLLAAHPEAKALEMPPHTPWHIGVQDNLRRSVEREKVEFFVVYARFADGSGEWVPATIGEQSGVEVYMEQDFYDLANQARSRKLRAVCHLHTHQVDYLRTFRGVGTQAQRMYNPPSAKDIHFSANVKRYYRIQGINPNIVHSAVADPRGVWYFAPMVEQKKRADAIGETIGVGNFDRTVGSFVYDSAKPNFALNKELPKLQAAYKTYMSADVRFVSYENIVNEPACAGVNYRP